MVKEKSNLLMVPGMRDSGILDEPQVMEDLLLKKEKFMKANGFMTRGMA